MTGHICRGLCERWKNMVNLISEIPYYVVADRCMKCSGGVWYPKNTIVHCPCCGTKLRYKKQQSDRRTIPMTQKEILEVLERYVAIGWKPINIKVYQDLQNYIIYEKEKGKLR